MKMYGLSQWLKYKSNNLPLADLPKYPIIGWPTQVSTQVPTKVPKNWQTYPSTQVLADLPEYPRKLADLPEYPSIGRPTNVPNTLQVSNWSAIDRSTQVLAGHCQVYTITAKENLFQQWGLCHTCSACPSGVTIYARSYYLSKCLGVNWAKLSNTTCNWPLFVRIYFSEKSDFKDSCISMFRATPRDSLKITC
jgi:hypothetical protein